MFKGKSIMEIVVQWHRVIPWVSEHYDERERLTGDTHIQDGIEHYWWGIIVALLFGLLHTHLHIFAYVVFGALGLWHVVIEEFVFDGGGAHKADVTLRLLGLIEGVAFVGLLLWLIR